MDCSTAKYYSSDRDSYACAPGSQNQLSYLPTPLILVREGKEWFAQDQVNVTVGYQTKYFKFQWGSTKDSPNVCIVLQVSSKFYITLGYKAPTNLQHIAVLGDRGIRRSRVRNQVKSNQTLKLILVAS